MDKKLSIKLNAGRCVTGVLRGFDPFMNLVLDESVEECKDGTRNNIGMVVSNTFYYLILQQKETYICTYLSTYLDRYPKKVCSRLKTIY